MGSRKAILFWIFFSIIVSIVFFILGVRLSDYAVYVALFLLLYIIASFIELPSLAVWLIGISTIPHLAGIYPINNAIIGQSLYSSNLFSGNYDLFTHFTGFMLLSIALIIIYNRNSSSNNNKFFAYAAIFFAAMGIGLVIEVAEFIGYSMFGFGGGAFMFGAGDNSYNFGPWGDSMTDSIANIAGIMLGFVLYYVIFSFRRNVFYARKKRIKQSLRS